MKLDALKEMKKAPEMPLGKKEVTFKKIQYRTDEEGNVNGIFVHIEEYRSLFIPFFEEDNFQLDLLLEQLGCESYDDEEINKASGTVIVATRYERGGYINVSFNPRGVEGDVTTDALDAEI